MNNAHAQHRQVFPGWVLPLAFAAVSLGWAAHSTIPIPSADSLVPVTGAVRLWAPPAQAGFHVRLTTDAGVVHEFTCPSSPGRKRACLPSLDDGKTTLQDALNGHRAVVLTHPSLPMELFGLEVDGRKLVTYAEVARSMRISSPQGREASSWPGILMVAGGLVIGIVALSSLGRWVDR